MNERIKELWEEAAKEPYGGTWEEHTAFMGKFAELIIRECAGVARQHILERHGMSTDYTGRVLVEDAIKNHFKEQQ